VTPRRGRGGERGDLPGLQAERTRLSWERAALAAVVNGALLLLRHAQGWLVLAPAMVGLALALALALVGTRRARRIPSGGHRVGTARGPVLISGATVALFGMTVLALLGFATPPP
jgi:putative membrane protein